MIVKNKNTLAKFKENKIRKIKKIKSEIYRKRIEKW